MVQFCSIGAGLINEVKIPVQDLGGQRGEGAYFLGEYGILCPIKFNDIRVYCSTVSTPISLNHISRG